MTLRGSVREFPLDAVLRFLAASGKSGRLDLRGAQGSGSVGIDGGRVSGAELGEYDGDAALGGLFAMSDGEFEFDLGVAPSASSITGGVEEVIARAREERDQLVAIREVVPADRLIFTLSERAAANARIELSSDQWLTLLSVNGERDVAGIADARGVKCRVALGLLAELVRAGAVDASEPPAWREPEPPVAEAWSAPAAAMTPAAEPETWSASAAGSEPQPAPAGMLAPDVWAAPAAEPTVQSWTAATQSPAPETWSVPPVAAPESWDAPAAGTGAPPAVDDRLAAIFGPHPSQAPVAPAPADTWSTPEVETWSAGASPSLADAAARVGPAELTAPPNPAPAPDAERERKRGLFGFGGHKEAVVPPLAASASATASIAGATRAGRLAAFTNALIAEYNSGHYGKGRIDGKIAHLLLRVDEQAEPVDRPMPIQGDTLSVQSLDSGVLPESQALPYLALLINQIVADAERALGKDKAKVGYRVARHQALGNDPLLDTPDLAPRLPMV